MFASESSDGTRFIIRAIRTARSAIGFLVDVALWLPRFWAARSELGNLTIMTELGCRDIGLTNCEIERYLTHRSRLPHEPPATPELEDRRFHM